MLYNDDTVNFVKSTSVFGDIFPVILTGSFLPPIVIFYTIGQIFFLKFPRWLFPHMYSVLITVYYSRELKLLASNLTGTGNLRTFCYKV